MSNHSELETSIREQYDQAEIIIGWIQLAFVLILLSIYTLAPKAHNGNTPFEPVPWVVGIYLPAVILRIYWGYRKLLNEAVLFIYCALDTLMVTALIFSFHLQYNAPSTVSLKAPTYLYLVMFLALRVLRHEVKYIATMGILSVISMSGLVIYAANDPAVSRTLSFTEYASSNSLLVGAEIDKILAVTLITAILVVAVYRSQKLMQINIKNSQARKDLTRFFSPEVAENIISSSNSIKPGTGKIRSAAILSMDIRGFTKFSQKQTPGQIMSLLSEYQAKMVKIILSEGGSIDKFMGDGILAHFGAAKATATYAADCLRAIDQLKIGVEKWNEERSHKGLPTLTFGISMAVGDIMFGAVGDQSRLEFTTIGDAVNLCAKLEKHTKQLNALALTTRKSLDVGYKQGYLQPSKPFCVNNSCCVEGLDNPIDLVTLYPQLGTSLEVAA